MFTKQDTIKHFLDNKEWNPAAKGTAYAPSNIALAKYWGKRDTELNLPANSSLSISLANKGAVAKISPIKDNSDHFLINQKIIAGDKHALRLQNYLNLFRGPNQQSYQLELEVNIPFAAGLASSACVFAAIILSLNNLYQWNLSTTALSILARLGSGSAARSVLPGFIEWQQGSRNDGLDSFAALIPSVWPEFCVGLCIFETREKAVSSREGMARTQATAPSYAEWVQIANQSEGLIKAAVLEQDFSTLGSLAEMNASAMHKTMCDAIPPLVYSTQETFDYIEQIHKLRSEGLAVYFTQDAGPNLKLLFLESDSKNVQTYFQNIEIIQPFKMVNNDAKL